MSLRLYDAINWVNNKHFNIRSFLQFLLIIRSGVTKGQLGKDSCSPQDPPPTSLDISFAHSNPPSQGARMFFILL